MDLTNEENQKAEHPNSNMEWVTYRNGYLTKANSGYFFIHEEPSHENARIRWFVEYERGNQAFQEQGITIAQHGFETQDDAKNAAEEWSKKTDAALKDKGSPRA
jgi:hypothetical protein